MAYRVLVVSRLSLLVRKLVKYRRFRIINRE